MTNGKHGVTKRDTPSRRAIFTYLSFVIGHLSFVNNLTLGDRGLASQDRIVRKALGLVYAGSVFDFREIEVAALGEEGRGIVPDYLFDRTLGNPCRSHNTHCFG